MTTDTLDLPPIIGIEPAATAVAPVSTTSEVSTAPKVTVRDAALQPLNALAPGLRAVTERYRAVAFDLKTPKGLLAAKLAHLIASLVAAALTALCAYLLRTWRPKLAPPGEGGYRDFVIREDKPGFVNLVGIESPGLTSALAIGEIVAQIVASAYKDKGT